ncbi:MAG: recombinase family protein [Desulfurococcales archaeon]|nr:recombinase family protein [Desulfurococcales archaeon]
MKAVAYIRVSTKEQDEFVQKKAIMDFARERNLEILKWYIDKGESGSKPFKNRPGASKLLEELDYLKPDCIVAWSLDRLGRTMLDTLNTVLELEGRGYKVITVKEEWLQSLNDNIRKLILSILSWVAEFERKRIRERQEEAWRQGKQKGRPPKVSDNVILKYLRKYRGLSKKDIWKIMKQDGYDLSYDRFLRRVKKLIEVVADEGYGHQ